MHVEFNSKEAEAAASLMTRTNMRRRKALKSLGAWAAEHGIFKHDTKSDDYETEWDRYEARCAAEKASDDVNVASVASGVAPIRIAAKRHEERITAKSSEALDALPQLKLRQNLANANVTDPTSVDYRDPSDFYRTPLIKAVIDRDIHEVSRLTEVEHANLYIRDGEGKTAYVMAMSYGYMDLATYLNKHMQAKPQIGSAKTKVA